ncbi:tryptophan 2,3-dioxygenase [Abortiporus biennis]|nr:tryptophan 2,3-dioxygenase [Abortiporus biennis]
MSNLPPDHFLALPRPDVNAGPLIDAPDTTTLAAHDFDVDNRTGFMPPQPPLTRLPEQWEPWESVLDEAIAQRLQLADKPGLTNIERENASRWQEHVRELPILPTLELKESEVLLRRAHHVLAWIMHFYIRTLPPTTPDIRIPPPITVPLLQVSSHLQLPPVLTYSDDVLYNWALIEPVPLTFVSPAPALDNLRCLTLFTGTRDEAEFYLASARIELRGVRALSLMRATMDEAFVGDDIAIKRITTYLYSLAEVIGDLTKLLLAVREGCDPMVFYNQIRPWFRGADSDTHRKWIFEGLELDPDLKQPTELSGPSAGQSSLVHALDIFLGVDRYSHAEHSTGAALTSSSSAPSFSRHTDANRSNLQTSSSSSQLPESASPHPTSQGSSVSFLTRMQSYMPRHHRAFLRHLSANPRPLRALVESANDSAFTEAYNTAVTALKVFRDAHVRIVALYIVVPARNGGRPEEELKGTGGTNSMKFVKSVRDQTAGAVIEES